MSLRYLVDTHVFVRWVSDPRRLSPQQLRTLRHAKELFQPIGLSTISLLEIAVLISGPKPRLKGRLDCILDALRHQHNVEMLPVTTEVAREIAAVGDSLRDPMDRGIVATARVHGLHLLTSDERIIDSKLVPVID